LNDKNKEVFVCTEILTDTPNKNGTIYPKHVLEKAIEEYKKKNDNIAIEEKCKSELEKFLKEHSITKKTI